MSDSAFLDYGANKCRSGVLTRLKKYIPGDKVGREKWNKIVLSEMQGECMALRVYIYYVICGCIVPSNSVALTWTLLKDAYAAYMQLSLYVSRPQHKQPDVYDIGIEAVKSLLRASQAETPAAQHNTVHMLSTKITKLYGNWLSELEQHMDELAAFEDKSGCCDAHSRQEACDAATCCITGINHTLRHLSFLRHNVSLIFMYLLRKKKFRTNKIHTQH